LTGEIAKALGVQAKKLFAIPPQIEKVEVLELILEISRHLLPGLGVLRA